MTDKLIDIKSLHTDLLESYDNDISKLKDLEAKLMDITGLTQKNIWDLINNPFFDECIKINVEVKKIKQYYTGKLMNKIFDPKNMDAYQKLIKDTLKVRREKAFEALDNLKVETSIIEGFVERVKTNTKTQTSKPQNLIAPNEITDKTSLDNIIECKSNGVGMRLINFLNAQDIRTVGQLKEKWRAGKIRKGRNVGKKGFAVLGNVLKEKIFKKEERTEKDEKQLDILLQ